MPPKKTKPKRKTPVKQKQKQTQKQVVNILLADRKRRRAPRQSSIPNTARVLNQFVQPMNLPQFINPIEIPAPFVSRNPQPQQPITAPLVDSVNNQPSIYRNLPLTPKQATNVASAKAVARNLDRKIKKDTANRQLVERTLMAVEDSDAFMMGNPLARIPQPPLLNRSSTPSNVMSFPSTPQREDEFITLDQFRAMKK